MKDTISDFILRNAIWIVIGFFIGMYILSK